MRLIANRRATPTTRQIRLALDGTTFRYKAGQAAWLGADGAHSELTPYSIASAPEETAREHWLEFLVKVDGATRFGSRVAALHRGADVTVSGPAGAFVFPDDAPERQFLFIAGGTGIAPLRSMLRHALERRAGARFALLYSARRPDEFAYLRELRALAKLGCLELALTLTGEGHGWRHNRGRVGAEHLAPLLERADTPPLCFVCGPASMVADMPATLVRLGVPAGRIRTDEW